MSKAPNMAANAPSQLPGLRGVRFSFDWITRPVFGIALAAIAIGSIAAGTYWFAAVTAIAAVAAAREWHRMVGGPQFTRELFIAAPAVALALFAAAALPRSPGAWIILAAAAVAVYGSARLRDALALWQAGGVLYLGVPAVSIVTLHRACTTWCVAHRRFLGHCMGYGYRSPDCGQRHRWSSPCTGVVAQQDVVRDAGRHGPCGARRSDLCRRARRRCGVGCSVCRIRLNLRARRRSFRNPGSSAASG